MVVVYVPDVSSAVDNKGHIIFDFLMPNGILITMKVDFYCATFEKIKQDLWLEASKQPLYFLLRSYEEYAFQFINNQGKREEVLWESQSLSEIQLCATFLKLIEKELNNERHYSLDRRINSLISIPSYELTDLQSSEVENFRVRIKAYCDKIVLERDHLGWDERIKYCFPPRLCKEELRANMVEKLNTEKLNEGYFSIEISRGKKVVKEEVLCNFYPKQLVSDLVKRRPKELGLKDLDATNYLLKVSGLDEYLYGNHALIDFKFIYECLHKDSVPRVCLVTRSEVCLPAPTIPPRKSSSSFSSRNTQENVIPDIHSWDIFSKVTIKINCVTQVEISDGNRIKVVAGLYLGHDVLCDVVSTDELALSQRTCVWNSELTFDHLVSDLPEMTRICFMLYSVGTGKNKKHKDANPLAWANIPLFDYKSQLRCNTCELFMWPIQDDLQLDEPCFPIVYCKSCADHTKDLIRQNEALLKINSANMLIKNTTLNIGDKKVKDTLLKDFQAVLSQKAYTEALNELHSPLNPLWKMNKLIIDECKFLDSKKRPVWLVWRNEEAYQSNEKFSIIYKNGDDLRQDMLTLQIIQIVDSIWQEEGVDLKMNPYGCLCTGENTGMIEVVSNAETIASIQRNYGAVKCVYEWLKQHNTTDEKLAKAVTDFSLSCAGYSVITYVLGIGDRHNDNIMIKTNGQLFHIDFGHILGNKKKKFGVRRERVPFVLTSHFVYVIKNGEGQNDNFQKFEENCQLAYMILRRRSHVLITLFNLMLQSGLPELSSDKDVEYLRKALALGASDQEASQQFRAKLKEAQNKCWTTELNWWFHSRNVDNT
ncbi:phosphatidylinositol 4,5-bisphosphate 3-kinase catalytic subunit beta isoform-like isoform X2 [Octopus vulgaris]|nr:phosphatidylinositol 4,5-bisphosphate 3-kinase catalytic subunit beta isoform-like isoform X2 [Octopus vulgaris]